MKSAVSLPNPAAWPHLLAMLQLAKPRVLALVLFCAVSGMLLAQPGWPSLGRMLLASLGIALMAAAAAMLNCLLERSLDARMQRTACRATARGEAGRGETLRLALLLGGGGMLLLWGWVNALTAWLTLASLLAYALVYTLLLKPRTPQNIVIGGISGAMPPLLGWTAMTGEISPHALLLLLIIYVWTPPHFWALALYRRRDYARAGLPMLPLTHGAAFTTLSILLYTVLLTAVSLLPLAIDAVGLLYLLAALILDARFLFLAVLLHRQYADALARRTFRWSIWYLAGLFGAMLLDHYCLLPVT
ncbi:heme O synthase [Aquitalea magnusonii]|uniref:Protoheme IX farnesyltransferase n=1 Tax=Aquitalea magnusonii TaxID=332411 RepID=A0A3G9GHG1_9NEIS|nr:heme o synthase [Aquitalea magnusonii]BBF87300.1 heme O synthase [Aquitalea magnusonii]